MEAKENPAPLAGGDQAGLLCSAASKPRDSPPADVSQIAAGSSTRDVRASLMRDFIFEALEPVERDSAAVRLCLANDDDVGARYHLKRVVECVKAAAATFREALTRDHSVASGRAA
jgi:hypothetical protein